MEIDEKYLVNIACTQIELGLKLLRDLTSEYPNFEKLIWSSIILEESAIAELRKAYKI